MVRTPTDSLSLAVPTVLVVLACVFLPLVLPHPAETQVTGVGEGAASPLGLLQAAYRSQGGPGAAVWYEDAREAAGGPLGLPLDGLVRMGKDRLRYGQGSDAVVFLEIATREHPEAPPAWLELGTALLYSGRAGEARGAFERAAALVPDNPGLRWYYLEQFEARREDAENETRAAPGLEAGEATGLHGPYLGQTPPGTTPQVFAPGIVSLSGRTEVHLSFSQDGRELFLTTQDGPLLSRWEEGGWTVPAPVLEGALTGFSEINAAPDGSGLWGNRDRAVWWVPRTPGGWGDAVLRFPDGMFASQASDSTVFLTLVKPEGGHVFRSGVRGGTYQEPERVEGGVYSPAGTAHPFIAPDQSFLLFDSPRPGGEGGFDLWISRRQGDGTWGEAVNLGPEVNSRGQNMCAHLTPDGKYLFFTRFGDIWWVSSEFLGLSGVGEWGVGWTSATGTEGGEARAWKAMTGMEAGPEPVGFRVVDLPDPGRGGLLGGGGRTIRAWLWYPAEAGTGETMLLSGYLEEAALDFSVAGGGSLADVAARLREGLLQHGLREGDLPGRLATVMLARADARPGAGPYPFLVLGQGLFYESPLAQAVLAEFLASHGFVVATAPLLGASRVEVDLSVADFSAEVDDLALLVARVPTLLPVDRSRVAAGGFDLGGMAAFILAKRDPSIRALVSLDSGIIFPHNMGLLEATPGFAGPGLHLPTLHATRDRAGNDAIGVSEDFRYFEDATTEDLYLARIPGIRHPDFTSFLDYATVPVDLPFWGPEVGDPRKARAQLATLVRDFLLAFLVKDPGARESLERRLGAGQERSPAHLTETESAITLTRGRRAGGADPPLPEG